MRVYIRVCIRFRALLSIQVLTAALTFKFFWDVTPCRFGGVSNLHLQVQVVQVFMD